MSTKININRASFEELQKIIHIGPKRAQKIIDNRPFKDIYELSLVKGLGKIRMNKIFELDIITTKL